MKSERIVIAGAGHAGAQLALMLRQKGHIGPITLIGEEPSVPYQRPPLSKTFLKDGNADRLVFRQSQMYVDHQIEVLLGRRVIDIGRKNRVAILDDGLKLNWDHFVLAVGTRINKPPILGIHLPGVFTLRTLKDAQLLRNAMLNAKHVAIIGGGFIGLEFASAARSAGADVTVFEGGSRILARAVSVETSKLLQNYHESTGVKIIHDANIQQIEAGRNGNAEFIHFKNGQVLHADLIVLAAGVAPNLELAQSAQLMVSNGIHTDCLLKTEDPNIYAIGDCSLFLTSKSSERVRLESVQAATDHARCLSSTLTGNSVEYDVLPWFWSDQGDKKLQIAGLSQPDDLAEHYINDDGSDLILRIRNDEVVAIETLNAPGLHIAARKLLEAGPLKRNVLEKFNMDLKACVSGRNI